MSTFVCPRNIATAEQKFMHLLNVRVTTFIENANAELELDVALGEEANPKRAIPARIHDLEGLEDIYKSSINLISDIFSDAVTKSGVTVSTFAKSEIQSLAEDQLRNWKEGIREHSEKVPASEWANFTPGFVTFWDRLVAYFSPERNAAQLVRERFEALQSNFHEFHRWNRSGDVKFVGGNAQLTGVMLFRDYRPFTICWDNASNITKAIEALCGALEHAGETSVAARLKSTATLWCARRRATSYNTREIVIFPDGVRVQLFKESFKVFLPNAVFLCVRQLIADAKEASQEMAA